MSKNNAVEKKNLKLHDLPSDVTKKDIETFLSKYKEQINTITIEDYKDSKKLAKISFKDSKLADDCRINMNLRKIKNLSIRIMWDEKDFQYKNYNKNNLYIKEIPKDKTSREVFEYFHKFGDIYSIKINEDEKGNIVGTGYITYYNQDSAKKAIDETNGKKIWNSNMELQYQIQHKNDRNFHHYNFNYHIYNYHNNDNLKICINNIPDSFTNDNIQKLCEEFGKIRNNNVSMGQYGKYAIVTFSNEQEAKKAIEKLNNKEIEGKKISVKEFQRKPNYQQHNNYVNYFNNNQFPRYEEPYENTNLYVRNIPLLAKEEDLRKVFEPFGKIKSIKLEMETKEIKENGETKIRELNKGFGYILYENVDSAKKALESLNNTHLQGFGSFPRPLFIEFFIPKKRREMMENMPASGYYMDPGMMFPQPFPGFPPHFQQMIGMPFNQFNRWNQGNFQNRGYNTGYKKNYNKRGGHRGGYYKGNNQRKNNNMNNQNQNDNNENKNNNKEKNLTGDENKKKFDYEAYNKITSKEEKMDFLGELLFNAILESPLKKEKNIDFDTIGKITGMIIAIPENEIIEILEKPQNLNARILEALSLITNNK